MPNEINVIGARVHNLKNIDVTIPRDSLTVITGLSGSGKSSLAFDTIYAEGQRRYLETMSAYARGFLGTMDKPDVDSITGLSPVISIEQKTTNKNPRSTVGTITEVYDFMRLLFARIGVAYSYATGEKMVRYSDERLLEMILSDYQGKRIYILAPIVRQRKGHYRELFEQMRKKGYLHVRVDGEVLELTRGMKVDRYKNHNIEVVIDKMKVNEDSSERLKKTIATAMKQGDGIILIYNADDNEAKHYSRRLMCPTTGMAYQDPAPNIFSFNSPEGACPRCKGLGYVDEIDIDKVIPNSKLSIHEGGIVPLGKYKNQMIFFQIDSILERNDLSIKTPIEEIPEEVMSEILYGSFSQVKIKKELIHTSSDYFTTYQGVVKYLSALMEENDDDDQLQSKALKGKKAQKFTEQFITTCQCPECKGDRLKRESLSYRIDNKNIADLSKMDVRELKAWFDGLQDKLPERDKKVSTEITNEINKHLTFLLDVGLDYISMNRPTATLSGGESQRIRLASQIGSQLVNVLYILDEPSIGLHQRDNERLIGSLQSLRDVGNTIVVVEHDRDMMLAADYVVDIGPRAGINGGEVVFEGNPKQMMKADTLTSRYISGKENFSQMRKNRPTNVPTLSVYGMTGNNLKSTDIHIPLGTLTLITGVSGSGKSSIINDTLQPILSQHFYRSLRQPLPYERIEGIENIDKVVSVDQSPIGRTPRSCPATYTGVFSDIRSLFVGLPEAKIRGYNAGRFSYNVKGGRCEECSGNGYKTIEMNFLPNVYVPCPVCQGKRYARETLEVRYKGKSIADVLNMTINEAVDFFENVPTILQKVKALQDVGLGYVTLGQSSTTLSGGESQRVKLATELARKDTGKTLYILDEPTTGLHFDDIRMLMTVLQKLVDRGNTVVIIEHNLDVISLADHIIDVGPDGGARGGRIVATGTPEEIAKCKESFTGKYL